MLFVVATAWRLLYVGRVAASPLGGSLRDDAHIYWQWADHILQTGPLGTHPFFLGPLYPYLLALLRWIGVTTPHGVLVVQSLWGAVSVVLLADATRRLAGPRAGLIVGLVMAGYETAVFFDGLVLSESLQFLLASTLIWWVARRDWATASWPPVAICGGLIGLSAVARANSAVLLLPAALLVIGTARLPRRMASQLAALTVGFLVVVLPVTVRNRVVSGEWIPLTYNLGLNLYVGNNPRAEGSYVHVTGEVATESGASQDGGIELDGRGYLRTTDHLSLTASGSSAYWGDKAWSHARQNPGRTLRLTVCKLGMLWNRREYAQIESVDQYRAVAGPLGWPVVGQFVLLGPLALSGLWFAWRRGPAGRFVAGYAVIMTLAIVPFFVTDRYRHQIVPAAAVLAGIGLHQLWLALARRERVNTWAAPAAALAGLVVVFLPAPAMNRDRFLVLMASDMGVRWLEHGHPDRSLREFQSAIARLGEADAAGRPPVLARSEAADLMANYGRTLLKLGRAADAVIWLERARQSAPGRATIQSSLASAYEAAGQAAKAESLAAQLENEDGTPGSTSLRKGLSAAQAGDLITAERMFQQAVREDPGLTAAWGALVRVQAQSGRLTDAATTLTRARAAGLAAPQAHVYEALLAALRGDASAAQRALNQVGPEVIAADPILADVMRVTRGALARIR